MRIHPVIGTTLLLLFLALAGCSDDNTAGSTPFSPTGYGDDDVTDAPLVDGGENGTKPDTNVEEEETGLLDFVDETGDDGTPCAGEPTCNISIYLNTDRTVAIRYTRDGEPVKNGLVGFAFAGDTSDGAIALNHNAAYTDEDGLADVDIVTNQPAPGIYDLVVTAEDATGITPITFQVEVTSKLGPPLIITFSSGYDPATTQFDYIETTLWKQTEDKPYACNDMDLTEKLPTGGIALPDVETVDDIIEVPALPGLNEEEPEQKYTVAAIGVTLDGAKRVAGCNDVDAEVELGFSNTADVILYPIPPDYTGRYDVVTHLDLTSALPDEVQSVLKIIFGLFESPTGGLVLIACEFGDSVSVLDELCGLVFADPDNPEIGEWAGGIGTIIIEVIDAILEGLIQSNDTASDVFYTGKDLIDILTQLELHSEIEMIPLPGSGKTKSMPDNQGNFTAEQCSQTWKEIAFKWTLGLECDPADETCGAYNFNFAQFSSTEVLTSQFPATVDPTFYDMNVGAHSVNFKYGALLNAIIKNFLLPAIFGDGSDGYPKVDEYEEVIQFFMCGKEGLLPQNDCCAIFAEEITNNGGGIIANTVEAACKSLIPLGITFLEALLIDLDVDVDNMTLQTATPCTLYDNDGDGTIDNWGSVEEPCLWTIEIDLFGLAAEFDAEFYGVRKQ